MYNFLPIIDNLIERLQNQEQLDLEFKDCRGGLSNDIWETISAFANSQGGWLLIGVDRKGVPVRLSFDQTDKLKKELFDLSRNKQKINRETFTDGETELYHYNVDHVDKVILIVRINAVSRTSKPVYINGNPYSGTFVRRHEGDYRCNEEEVKRMIRDASTDAIDSSVLDYFAADAFLKDTIRRFRQRLQNRNPEHEFNDYDEERFLNAISATDHKTNKITIAGLLMFGNEFSLRKWRKRHLIDFRINSEHIKETIWIDRIAWEGNLLDGYFKIFPKLTEGIHVPHIIRNAESIEDTPLHIALREAFINLLVHTDYAESDVSLIIKSPEGYFFRNPGASRITQNDLFAGNRSDPRNPNLLFMFRLIGLAEEAGSGIPKIIRNWKSLGFQLPNVEVGTERYEFAIQLKNAHLLTDEDRKWLKILGGGFDEHQQLALVCARHEGKIDNERLRTMSVIHPSDATRILTGLRNAGLLNKVNDRRGSFYIIPADIQGPTLFNDLIEALPADIKGVKQNFKTLKEIPETLKENLKTLKEDAEILKETSKILKENLKRSVRRELMELVIIRLCELAPRKANELSKSLKIRQTTLSTSYLNLLLKSEKILWTGKSRRDKSGTYIAKKNG